MFNRLKNNESGQSMVFVALILTVLMGFGALAIDIGYMTHQRSTLQTAADSAALAGALIVPTTTDNSIVQGKIEDYAQANDAKLLADLSDSNITKKIIDRSKKTVEVEIQQIVPKFLGGILDNTDKTMTVRAIAKYNAWPGNALPFINLDDSYLTPNKDVDSDGDFDEVIIDLWEKTGSGEFERLIEKYIPAENAFLVIDEEDRVTIDSGRTADIKKNLDAIVLPAIAANKPVYVLSLVDDKTGDDLSKAELETLFTKDSGKIKAPLSDLVLLKGYIINYEFTNANTFVLQLKIEGVFGYSDVYDEIILDSNKKLFSYLIQETP